MVVVDLSQSLSATFAATISCESQDCGKRRLLVPPAPCCYA